MSLDISLQGMNRAAESFDRAAGGIARASLPAAPSQPEDTVSLSDQAVALMQAANDFKANAQALKTGDEMTQYLLDQLR
jgi:Flagellar basal body rod FlgEFG protein C-terminal